MSGRAWEISGVPKRKPSTSVKREQPEMPEELEGFPKRLREAIDDVDLNATQAAEACGVSTQVITRGLKGERLPGMRAASVIKIAKGLGVDHGWLLSGYGNKRTGITTAFDSPEAKSTLKNLLAEMGYEPTKERVVKDKGTRPTKRTK